MGFLHRVQTCLLTASVVLRSCPLRHAQPVRRVGCPAKTLSGELFATAGGLQSDDWDSDLPRAGTRPTPPSPTSTPRARRLRSSATGAPPRCTRATTRRCGPCTTKTMKDSFWPVMRCVAPLCPVFHAEGVHMSEDPAPGTSGGFLRSVQHHCRACMATCPWAPIWEASFLTVPLTLTCAVHAGLGAAVLVPERPGEHQPHQHPLGRRRMARACGATSCSFTPSNHPACHFAHGEPCMVAFGDIPRMGMHNTLMP